MRGRTKPRRIMEWGEEAQCSRCKGWWPADREFFRTHRGVLNCWCKACEAEVRNRAKERMAA